MLIDAHAHYISEFFDDYEYYVEKAENNEVKIIFNTADSLNSSIEVIELNKKYPMLLPVIGVHPTNIRSNFIDELKQIKDMALKNKVYAIGEIGLDYHAEGADKSLQKEAFEAYLRLAQELNLPVVIHSRDATIDTVNILKRYKVKGIIHCFSGSYEDASEYISLGFLLGIGGILTFKNSKLFEVIEKIDLSNIVLETDSPFLCPDRGKKNDSSYIKNIAIEIAKIKNISVKEIENKTTENVLNLFKYKIKSD